VVALGNNSVNRKQQIGKERTSNA